MTDDRHISYDELALHAMHALSAEESAAVRLHVAECAECREQLADITGDLALVALSVEQEEIPEGARQRFVDRITAEPGAEISHTPVEPARTPVIPISRERRAPRSWSWVPWAAAAALMILCANLFVRIKIMEQQLDVDATLLKLRTDENARARMVLEVLTAPAAQRVMLTTGKTPPAPWARVVYLPSRGALVLQASDMPPMPANKMCELWVIPDNGAPIPAGLFKPDASGGGGVMLLTISPGVTAKAFGITFENEGGASTPTLPIVLSGTVPAAGE